MPLLPPILPERALESVTRIARRDGMTILIVAGIFAVASAAIGERWGAAVGVAIAAAGVFELHGAALLQSARAGGMRWLVASQVYLMFAVLAYVAWRIYAFDEAHLREFMLATAERRELLERSGTTPAEMLRFVRAAYMLCYMLVALLTVIYQGGMALFFIRRRQAVTAALAE